MKYILFFSLSMFLSINSYANRNLSFVAENSSKQKVTVIQFDTSVYISEAIIYTGSGEDIVGSVFIANSDGHENVFPISDNKSQLEDKYNAFKSIDYDNGFRFSISLPKKGLYILRVFLTTVSGKTDMVEYAIRFDNLNYSIVFLDNNAIEALVS